MKIDMETKYSVGDMVFMPWILTENGSKELNIRCRKIQRIEVLIPDGKPEIVYVVENFGSAAEDKLFENLQGAFESGTAKLVAIRISDNTTPDFEDEDDDDDEWDEDDD